MITYITGAPKHWIYGRSVYIGEVRICLKKLLYLRYLRYDIMMASSNGNIFRVTGHLCGEFTGHRWIPHTKASDAELWYFCFYLCTNKRLSKQSSGWWFETPSGSLWRHHFSRVKYETHSLQRLRVRDFGIKIADNAIVLFISLLTVGKLRVHH